MKNFFLEEEVPLQVPKILSIYVHSASLFLVILIFLGMLQFSQTLTYTFYPETIYSLCSSRNTHRKIINFLKATSHNKETAAMISQKALGDLLFDTSFSLSPQDASFRAQKDFSFFRERAHSLYEKEFIKETKNLIIYTIIILFLLIFILCRINVLTSHLYYKSRREEICIIKTWLKAMTYDVPYAMFIAVNVVFLSTSLNNLLSFYYSSSNYTPSFLLQRGFFLKKKISSHQKSLKDSINEFLVSLSHQEIESSFIHPHLKSCLKEISHEAQKLVSKKTFLDPSFFPLKQLIKKNHQYHHGFLSSVQIKRIFIWNTCFKKNCIIIIHSLFFILLSFLYMIFNKNKFS